MTITSIAIAVTIYSVFIKYCVFSEDIKIFPDSCLPLFSLGVSVCTHARQVEHQRYSRTGRVQKILKNLRKNTIFNEHPVAQGTIFLL